MDTDVRRVRFASAFYNGAEGIPQTLFNAIRFDEGMVSDKQDFTKNIPHLTRYVASDAI
jgi:hypothetical protein